MDTPSKTTPDLEDDSSSLEGTSPVIQSPTATVSTPGETADINTVDTVQPAPSEAGAQPTISAKPSVLSRTITNMRSHLNIYLLFFIIVLLIAGAILVITALSGKETKEPSISSQTLSQATLKQLANTDTTVGDPKQILNVQSNAVFAGKVLVRGSLDVAGQINVGGSLSLPGIIVSGDSQFDQVQVNKSLTVGGDTSFQGQLTVRKNVTINGSGTFGGPVSAPQISTSNLQLLGDLNLTRHIVAGGVTPGRTIGSAVGAGGTGSVSGSDNGGTINLNSGSSPAAGCLITVTFVAKYNNTPHVVITPVGSSAAGLDYYVNRTTTSFSICSLNPPTANASFGFDYFILG